MDEPNDQQEPAPSFETPDKKKLSLRNKLLLTGAGVVLVAVVATGTGLAVLANGHKSPEAASSSAPATPNPVETHAATGVEAPILTGEALTKAFTIPESLTGDDLAKTFIQKIQDWGQYGENLDTIKSHIKANGTDNLDAQSQAGGQTIAEALVTSENITSPLMSKFVNDQIQENIAITDAWSKTYFEKKSDNPFPYVDIEPFNQTLQFDSTSNVSTDEATGETTMDIHFTQNTDLKNLLDPTQPSTINPDDAGFARNNVPVTWRVIFVHENGATKAKSVIIVNQ